MKSKFEALYELREAALRGEADLLDVENEAELVANFEAELDRIADQPKSTSSFRRQIIASLLPKMGAGAETILMRILNDDDAHVRESAMRAGVDLGRERYPELVLAIERNLDNDLRGPWLRCATPLLLAALSPESEPPLDVILRFADHEDPDAAAEGLCALFELRIPGVEGLFESLLNDERPLANFEMNSEQSELSGQATVGELAAQLLSLGQLEEDLPLPEA